MPRLQVVMFFIFSMFFNSMASAADCMEYTIHGWVQEKDNSVVMLLNPGSRSEVKVLFPESMQSVLKEYLGLRIEVDAPATAKNKYLYQVYYQQGKVKSYPYSPEKRDQIKAITQNKFSCEK